MHRKSTYEGSTALLRIDDRPYLFDAAPFDAPEAAPGLAALAACAVTVSTELVSLLPFAS
jgi:hypothetical protein